MLSPECPISGDNYDGGADRKVRNSESYFEMEWYKSGGGMRHLNKNK